MRSRGLRRAPPRRGPLALAAFAVLLGACTTGSTAEDEAAARITPTGAADGRVTEPPGPHGVVTLGFAGDMHFELHLAALLEEPQGALGAITRTLREPDLTMVNLETSIAARGVPLHKGHPFRTTPAALDLLHAAGVDVVSLANNHAVDYGPRGLQDTLTAVRAGPVAVVGIGRDQEAAFTPHRVSVRGTEIAFLAASSEPDQLARSAAGPGKAGIAAAPTARRHLLLDAVREAGKRDDIVVVYLHWGKEGRSCPTTQQRTMARALAGAGADVIVGSHAHVPLGSGWLDDTYVSYGLGNFLWYHNHAPDTGVLRVRIRDGAVVGDSWAPARLGTYGVPRPLVGKARGDAVADWRRLRGCADLAQMPPG